MEWVRGLCLVFRWLKVLDVLTLLDRPDRTVGPNGIVRPNRILVLLPYNSLFHWIMGPIGFSLKINWAFPHIKPYMPSIMEFLLLSEWCFFQWLLGPIVFSIRLERESSHTDPYSPMEFLLLLELLTDFGFLCRLRNPLWRFPFFFIIIGDPRNNVARATLLYEWLDFADRYGFLTPGLKMLRTRLTAVGLRRLAQALLIAPEQTGGSKARIRQ